MFSISFIYMILIDVDTTKNIPVSTFSVKPHSTSLNVKRILKRIVFRRFKDTASLKICILQRNNDYR